MGLDWAFCRGVQGGATPLAAFLNRVSEVQILPGALPRLLRTAWGALIGDRVPSLEVSVAREVAKPLEDSDRKNVTVSEAAEYLGLSRTTVQEMVDRGQIRADRFAGAIHIPREEVERVERETAP